jgi:hypothetical protein
MNDEQRAGLYGPLYRYSDNKVGETIRFLLHGREVSGVISWVIAPVAASAGKRQKPCTYLVEDTIDPGTEMPCMIYPGEVIF